MRQRREVVWASVLVLAGYVLSASAGIHLDIQLFFAVDYGQVYRNLKGSQGRPDELGAVQEADRTGTLAKFWMQWALDYCRAVIQPGQSVYDALKDTEACRYQYFYDHWDELNQMIHTQYQSLQKKGARPR